MPLISHSVPSLVGGVSQLSAHARNSANMETMENGWPSLTAGLQKRAPLEAHGEVALPLGTIIRYPCFHVIERDGDERYLVYINHLDDEGRPIRVWDLDTVTDGKLVEKRVRMSVYGKKYLAYVNAGGPVAREDDYRFQTIGDLTIIVNRRFPTPAYMWGHDVLPTRADEALIYVKQSLGDVSENVVLTLNTHSTAMVDGVSTAAIAANLFSVLSGDDSPKIKITSVDLSTNRLTATDAALKDGMPIRVSVENWKDGGVIRYRVRETYYVATGDRQDRGWRWRWIDKWIDQNATVYVRDIKGTGGVVTFELAHQPGGGAVDITEKRSHLNYVRIGLGAARADYLKHFHVERAHHQSGVAPSTGNPGGEPSSNTKYMHQGGNVLYIKRDTDADFAISHTDAGGGEILDIIKGDASTVSELPNICKPGFYLRITGGEDTSLDDFYVEFQRKSSVDNRAGSLVENHIGKGVWAETGQEGLRTTPTSWYMPHGLIREADGGFVFRTLGPLLTQCDAGPANGIRVAVAYGAALTSDTAADQAVLYDDGDEVQFRTYYPALIGTTQKRQAILPNKKYWIKARSTADQPQSRSYTPGSTPTSTGFMDSYQDIEIYSKAPTGSLGSYVFDPKYRMVPTVKTNEWPTNADGNRTLIMESHEHPDIAFKERMMGDTLTNPTPSFITDGAYDAASRQPPISDVAVFKNRLVFASGDKISFSEYGEYLNFFRATVTTLLDTAAFELTATGSRVEKIESLQPFGDYLVASTATTQYIITAPMGQPFGPKTAEIRLGANLRTQLDTMAVPVISGDSMFFATTSANPTDGQAKGNYSGLAEFRSHPQVRGQFLGQSLTETVPRFIQGVIRSMAVDERSGVLATVGWDSGVDAPGNQIYVHKLRDAGGQRVQSAWFTLKSENAFFRFVWVLDGYLYFVTTRGLGWHVERMNLGDAVTDYDNYGVSPAYTDKEYVTYLDRRFAYTVGADSANATAIDAATGALVLPTSFTSVPGRTLIGWEQVKTSSPTNYTPYDLEYILEDDLEVVTMAGERLTVVEVLPSTDDFKNCIVVEGTENDYSGQHVWIGEKYTMSCQFSEQRMKETIGQAKFPLSDGRLQLRRGSIDFHSSAYLKVEVDPQRDDKDAYTYEMSNIADRSQGKLIRTTGELRFPIQSKNDEVKITLINDSPFPSNIASAEFESTYHRKARRVQM